MQHRLAPLRHALAGLLLLAATTGGAAAQGFDSGMSALAERVAEALSIRNLGREVAVDIYVRPPFDDVYRVVCAPLSRRLAREIRAGLPRAFGAKNLARARVVQRAGQGPGQFILNVSWRDVGPETLEVAVELGDLSVEDVATVDGHSVEIVKAELRGPEADCLAELNVINHVETAEEQLYVHRSADVFSGEIGVIEQGQRYRLLGRMPYTGGDWAVVKLLDGAPDDSFAETVGFATVPPTVEERAAAAKAVEDERKAAEAKAAAEKAASDEVARKAAEAEAARKAAEDEANRKAAEAEAARKAASDEAARKAAEAEAARKAAEAKAAAEKAAADEAARKAAADEAARKAAADEANRKAAAEAAARLFRQQQTRPAPTPPPPPPPPPPPNANAALAGTWQCQGSQPLDQMTVLQLAYQVAFLVEGSYSLGGQVASVSTFNNQIINQMAVGEYGLYGFDGQTLSVNPQGSIPQMPLAPYQVTISGNTGQSLTMSNYATGGQFQCQRVGAGSTATWNAPTGQFQAQADCVVCGISGYGSGPNAEAALEAAIGNCIARGGRPLNCRQTARLSN